MHLRAPKTGNAGIGAHILGFLKEGDVKERLSMSSPRLGQMRCGLRDQCKAGRGNSINAPRMLLLDGRIKHFLTFNKPNAAGPGSRSDGSTYLKRRSPLALGCSNYHCTDVLNSTHPSRQRVSNLPSASYLQPSPSCLTLYRSITNHLLANHLHTSQASQYAKIHISISLEYTHLRTFLSCRLSIATNHQTYHQLTGQDEF